MSALDNAREAAELYVKDCIPGRRPVPTEAGREYIDLKTGA